MIRLAFAILLIALSTTVAASKGSEDYSKRILGRWFSPKNRIWTFHVNGTWGVQRHETAPEGIDGRRWRIDGKKLIVSFPSDNGVGTPVHTTTLVYTIISFTPHSFTTQGSDGYKDVYERAP